MKKNKKALSRLNNLLEMPKEISSDNPKLTIVRL